MTKCRSRPDVVERRAKEAAEEALQLLIMAGEIGRVPKAWRMSSGMKRALLDGRKPEVRKLAQSLTMRIPSFFGLPVETVPGRGGISLVFKEAASESASSNKGHHVALAEG